MLALTLRGLAARKLRTALTATAVVLGVALISGTFIITDTIDRSFDSIFTQAYSGFDAAIGPKEVVDAEFEEPPAIPAALVERARRVEGVDRAVGSLFSEAIIYDRKGERLSKGAPNFVTNAQPAPFNPFDYTTGRAPRSDDEAALDRFTAREQGFEVGDRVRISGDGPQRSYRLVGIARYGEVDSLAGASAAILTLGETQRVAGKLGKVDEIELTAEEGVSPALLVRRLRAVMPAGVNVRTSRQEAATQAKDIKESFRFIRSALLGFAGVALFVGGFMIFNTFSITVAQRMREFAMLRTLGASRRQVLRSVLFEATLIGLGASVLGLLAGLALAPALNALFQAFGLDLPSQGTAFRGRTVLVSLLVGTLITVISSLAPALRATHVPPIAALREGAVLPRGRVGRRRTPIALALIAIGAGILLYGLFGGGGGSQVAALLGVGAVIVFIGVGMVSSKLVAPLASLVGRPIERVRGIAGRLARENAVRNPGRTAGTAAALMVGLALVTFVAIFTAGTRGSVDQAVDRGFRSDLILQNTDGFSPFTATAGTQAAQVPGVAFSTPLRVGSSRVKGVKGTASVTALEPATGSRVFTLEWKRGSRATLAALGPRDTVVDDKWGKEHGFGVGDSIEVTTPRGRRLALRIRGSYRDRLDFGGDYIVPVATALAEYDIRNDQYALLELDRDADAGAVQRSVESLLGSQFPSVEALTVKEFKEEQSKQINQLVGLVYVLLSLSVIVSLFGIVNTLALSIHERTRELGMLRAIGTSRAQVRRIVRYESVITAMIGAVLGSVLGVLFALVISRPLEEDGFSLSFPVATLALLLVLAAIAGVLAAIGPARRASRIDVLEALAYE